ncbi:DUF192 domain-containing protein [Govanella unica]|uniref:DUF192 domain-containing protein n=1 Tax=Govanella unica TaxID=2975056 RepID=A0A9X3TY29_9PROT|nr:DUF192 domain-containing protein [Govania unica]MDA5193659.1 DUF192 domain-containing protein [Govania unica]
MTDFRGLILGSTRRRSFAWGLAALLGLLPVSYEAHMTPQSAFAGEALSRLTLLSQDGGKDVRHLFQVEIADTDKERLRGLMYRKTLPDDGGMLFDYGEDREVAMWMRNTLIPLDMLFIDKAGVVRHIHENAIPHDETPIASGVPVRAVLELKGGTVAKLGLREGDRVIGALFGDK